MAWCCQPTSHYLSQSWPRSMTSIVDDGSTDWHVNTVETLYSTIYYSKYFIELNIDKSTQYVALWTHKRHPIPRPFGRAMECLLWVLQQKLIVLFKGFLLYLCFPFFEGQWYIWFSHYLAYWCPGPSCFCIIMSINTMNIQLTHWPPGSNFEIAISKHMLQIKFTSTSSCETASCECHWTPLMICQHWFRTSGTSNGLVPSVNKPLPISPYGTTRLQWVNPAGVKSVITQLIFSKITMTQQLIMSHSLALRMV